MNCVECGYNIGEVPRAAACPACGTPRDPHARLLGCARRDSLEELALWGSIGLGVVATLSVAVSPLFPRLVLLAGVVANVVLAVVIERTCRPAGNSGRSTFPRIRALGLLGLRLVIMWFASVFSSAPFEIMAQFVREH